DHHQRDRRVHACAAGARLVQGACRAFAGLRRGTLGTDRAAVKRFVLVVVAAALFAPAAGAARYAVGVRTIADLPRLRAAVPGAESLAPVPALIRGPASPPPLAQL